MIGNFKLGVPHGHCITITEDTCNDEMYLDGRENGYAITTFKNGTVVYENYKNGTIT